METGLVKQTSFTTPRLAESPGLDIDSQRGARRAEYLLVIYPNGELQEKLLEEQQQFSADYGLQMTVRNKPHITVAAFQAGEIMEETLIRWVQRICNSYKSFELTLNNYSGFPPHTLKLAEPAGPPGQSFADGPERAKFSPQHVSGTIYLRVQDPHPFRQLMQQLRSIDEFIRSSGCPPANLVSRPFLSIAGGLTEQVYNKAMPDYSRRTFHGSFQVDELVLLKRTHAFDACKTVNIFRLASTALPPQHL
jgi:2'-5' RNA ligase